MRTKSTAAGSLLVLRSSLASAAIAALAIALSPVSASAADLYGSKDGYGMDGTSVNWSGGYLGVHAGYGWGDADVTDTNGGVTPGPFSYSPNGAFGGATAGYNLQFSHIVVGVEGDVGFMDVSGDGRVPSSNPDAHQDLTLDGGFYAVAAGRVGLAVDGTLFYAKGGWAYFDGEASQKTTNPGYTTQSAGAFSGFAYGGGVEHMISSGLSLKVEYLHFDFDSEGGSQTNVGDTSSPAGFVFKNETDLQVDTVKLGLNYRWY